MVSKFSEVTNYYTVLPHIFIEKAFHGLSGASRMNGFCEGEAFKIAAAGAWRGEHLWVQLPPY